MTKRSEKEARENSSALGQALPLLAVTTALAYLQYRALKRRYLANPGVKRVGDFQPYIPEMIALTVGVFGIAGGLLILGSWTLAGHRVYVPVLALAIWAGWWVAARLLDAQAGYMLGVVIDPQAGTLTAPSVYPPASE